MKIRFYTLLHPCPALRTDTEDYREAVAFLNCGGVVEVWDFDPENNKYIFVERWS